jgi:hypothetical protein
MRTFDLTRKELPPFGVLENKKFDIEKIISHCQIKNLLDEKIYNDIQVSSKSNHEKFVRLNSFNKMSFFTEKEASFLEGDLYRQLYLTDLKPELQNLPVNTEKNNFPGSRFRRLDPNNKNYDPLVDELNYTHRNELVNGVFEEILDSFKDTVTRVRLSFLAPNFEIKPHVDHDPSYIVRYHIPIITDLDCYMNVHANKTDYKCHFPADGRVYFLNTGLKHWASNKSSIWRLHLIVDVHGQEELKSLCKIGC